MTVKRLLLLFYKKSLAALLCCQFGFIFGIHAQEVRKIESKKSLFQIPNSYSVELAQGANFDVETPPINFKYLSAITQLRGSYTFAPRWSVVANTSYARILARKTIPYYFPDNIYNFGVGLRYFFVARHSGLYADVGPRFTNTRIPTTRDTAEYTGIYPFVNIALGAMMKVGNGFYFHARYNVAPSLKKGYMPAYGGELGFAYYINPTYSEYKKPYKTKDRSIVSPYYVSAGLGYFPSDSSEFNTEAGYNIFMFNGKFGYNLTNALSVGMLATVHVGTGKGEGTGAFPGMGPYFQITAFNSKPFTLNVHTGILFSDLFLPASGALYHSFMTYLPIGLGFSKKFYKIKDGLSLDFSFAHMPALGGKKRPEGNMSYMGLGFRYDFKKD